MPTPSDRWSGALSTLLAGTFWGVSGTVAQILFVRFGFPALGLLTIRLLLPGTIMVAIFGYAHRSPLSRSFLAVAILGFALSQFAYLEAIQHSNAVTATLLQFLFLPLVAAYEGLRRVVIWSARWTAILSLAAVGTVLLVVNTVGGSLGLSVTPLGLFFGLMAAVTTAYETLAGGRVARVHGAWATTSWGFFIGGLASLPFGAASLLTYSVSGGTVIWVEVIALAGFVGLGTLIAYGFYLVGLRHLTATEVGVLASVEPIAAGAATFVLLGITLTAIQYLGGVCIVIAVALLGSSESKSSHQAAGNRPEPRSRMLDGQEPASPDTK